MSTIASHSPLNSSETVRYRTANRKRPMGNRMVTSLDPEMSSRDPNTLTANISKTTV